MYISTIKIMHMSTGLSIQDLLKFSLYFEVNNIQGCAHSGRQWSAPTTTQIK